MAEGLVHPRAQTLGRCHADCKGRHGHYAGAARARRRTLMIGGGGPDCGRDRIFIGRHSAHGERKLPRRDES